MKLFTVSDLAIALVLCIKSAIASRLLAGKRLLTATTGRLLSKQCELQSMGLARRHTIFVYLLSTLTRPQRWCRTAKPKPVYDMIKKAMTI